MEKTFKILSLRKEGRHRLVYLDGKCIGSGGYRKYKKKTACLKYMYVDPSDEYDVNLIYEELYVRLEQDMIEEGFKKVFTLCDGKDIFFYEEKGYKPGKERNYKKLAKLMGAYVTHDLTVQKKLDDKIWG